MKSSRLQSRSASLQHYTNSNLATQKHSLRHAVGERSCLVHFDMEGTKLANLKFSGDLGEWEALFDLYLDLLQNQELENVKKIGVKDLDHYLRDTPSVPTFEYYPDAIYQIVRLPWAMAESIKTGQEQVPFYSKQKYGEFLKLPFGMQLELLEDFFSEFEKIKCEFVDLDGNQLRLKRPENCDMEALQRELLFHFHVRFELL